MHSRRCNKFNFVQWLEYDMTFSKGLGKFKTIAIGISVYVVGMCMTAVGSMPEIFGSPVNPDGSRPDDYWQNNIQAIRGVALRPVSENLVPSKYGNF